MTTFLLTNSIREQAIFKLLFFKNLKRAYQYLRYIKHDINWKIY